MVTTSATGGFLVPAPLPAPLEDLTLEDFLQQFVVGLTALPGELVRPRWQPEPPNLPAYGTDWAAFGVVNQIPDTYGYVKHVGRDADLGHDELQRHEQIEALCSFYGPNSERVAQQFCDGLLIAQNRELLTLNGFGQTETTGPRAAPTLIKERWTRKHDVSWHLRRRIQRSYGVLNLASAQGTIYRDGTPQLIDTIDVEQ